MRNSGVYVILKRSRPRGVVYCAAHTVYFFKIKYAASGPLCTRVLSVPEYRFAVEAAVVRPHMGTVTAVLHYRTACVRPAV